MGGRKLDAGCGYSLQECYVERENHFPPSTGFVPVHTAQEAVGCLCCQGRQLARVQLAVCQGSWSLSIELLPRQSVPSLCCCKRFFLPRCRTWHFSLCVFIRFLSACSSSMLETLWMVALLLSVLTFPPSLVSTAKHFRRCSVASSKSLLKLLARTGLRTDPVMVPH